MRTWLIAAMAGAAVGCGCSAFQTFGKVGRVLGNRPINPGDVLVTVEESPMQEVQGETDEKMDYRKALRGRLGSVVATGAVLEVGQMVYTTGPAENKPHAIWVYTQVKSSPLEAQVGWKGWIHRDTTRPRADAGTPAVKPLDVVVSRPSKMCPAADSNQFQCNMTVPGGVRARLVECEGDKARIELWDVRGLYTNGYVKRGQFDDDPCGH